MPSSFHLLSCPHTSIEKKTTDIPFWSKTSSTKIFDTPILGTTDYSLTLIILEMQKHLQRVTIRAILAVEIAFKIGAREKPP